MRITFLVFTDACPSPPWGSRQGQSSSSTFSTGIPTTYGQAYLLDIGLGNLRGRGWFLVLGQRERCAGTLAHQKPCMYLYVSSDKARNEMAPIAARTAGGWLVSGIPDRKQRLVHTCVRSPGGRRMHQTSTNGHRIGQEGFQAGG